MPLDVPKVVRKQKKNEHLNLNAWISVKYSKEGSPKCTDYGKVPVY